MNEARRMGHHESKKDVRKSNEEHLDDTEKEINEHVKADAIADLIFVGIVHQLHVVLDLRGTRRFRSFRRKHCSAVHFGQRSHVDFLERVGGDFFEFFVFRHVCEPNVGVDLNALKEEEKREKQGEQKPALRLDVPEIVGELHTSWTRKEQ